MEGRRLPSLSFNSQRALGNLLSCGFNRNLIFFMQRANGDQGGLYRGIGCWEPLWMVTRCRGEPICHRGRGGKNQVQMLEPAKHRHVSFLPHSLLQLFITLLCARCFLDLETQPWGHQCLWESRNGGSGSRGCPLTRPLYSSTLLSSPHRHGACVHRGEVSRW